MARATLTTVTALCLSLAGAVLGCQRAPATAPPATAPPATAPVTAGSTALDPRQGPAPRLHYSPRPGDESQDDGVHALRLEGAERQARAAAVAFIEAFVRGDSHALLAMLAPALARDDEGTTPGRESDLTRCLAGARSLEYEPGLEAGELIDLESIVARPAADYHRSASALPAGVEAADLVVIMRPRPSLPALLRHSPCLSRLYVRPGPKPLVVALGR